jgi:hypothetical protein
MFSKQKERNESKNLIVKKIRRSKERKSGLTIRTWNFYSNEISHHIKMADTIDPKQTVMFSTYSGILELAI